MRHITKTALLAVLFTLCSCGGDDGKQPAPPPPPQQLAQSSVGGPAAHPAPPPALAPLAVRPMPPSAAAASGAAPDIGQLRQEVASLRREVAEMRLMLARAAPAAQPGAAPGAPNTGFPAESQQVLAPAEASFRGEPLDAGWSQTASTDVRAAIGRANPTLEAQVNRIECRSKTCRIEVSAASAGAMEIALPTVLANLNATMPNMTGTQVGSDDASQPAVLYLTR